MNLLVVMALGTRFQNDFLYCLSLFLIRLQQQPQQPQLIYIRQAVERFRESGLRLLASMMSQWNELMSFVYKSALLHGGTSTAAVLLSVCLVGTFAVVWQLVLLCFRCLGSVVHFMATVLHWMWAFLRHSLIDAASKVAGQHVKTLRELLEKAEAEGTKVVLFAHSHGGMVAQAMIDKLPLQLVQHLIVVGLGNPNTIRADGEVQVFQYHTSQDLVAGAYSDAGVQSISLSSLEALLLNWPHPPDFPAGLLPWHECRVYLALLHIGVHDQPLW